MVHLTRLARDLPNGEIQVSFDGIEEKLQGVSKGIHHVQVSLGCSVDPVVPDSYLAGTLDNASRVLQGVLLVESQNQNTELGFARWMMYQERKWDLDILEALGPARNEQVVARRLDWELCIGLDNSGI